jgi:hypothetical protein
LPGVRGETKMLAGKTERIGVPQDRLFVLLRYVLLNAL